MIMGATVIYLCSGCLFAANIKVVGPCFEKPVFEKDFKIKNFKDSAAKISMVLLKENDIEHKGDEDGFASILNTPSGSEAIESVSNGKMRFYGWCFSVNSILPGVMPGDFYFSKASDKIVWFYGYLTYDNGKWSDVCEPSYKIQASQFCPAKSVNIADELSKDIESKESGITDVGVVVYERLIDFTFEIRWRK